jgi:PEGA domain
VRLRPSVIQSTRETRLAFCLRSLEAGVGECGSGAATAGPEGVGEGVAGRPEGKDTVQALYPTKALDGISRDCHELRLAWHLRPMFFNRPVRRALRSVATLSLVASLGVTGGPSRAWAQDPAADTSAEALKRAREQFGQALALQTAGDWAGALALLKDVAAVKSTPQVRFNMALCEEKLGKLVAALGDYELAAADARAEKADQVAEEVEGRLEALRQRIPKITVKRGSGAEAAIVAVDGVSLGDQVIGTPMPTDPGPHTVEAKAPGFKPFRQSIRLAEQQSATVEIVLEPEPAPPPTAGAVGSDGRGSSARGARIAGYVIGGVGLASLGASGIFFGLRANKISELDKACPNQKCPSGAQQSDIDAGKRYTTIANVTLAVGAAAVAASLVLVLTSGPSSEPNVALAPAPGGLQLLGKF